MQKSIIIAGLAVVLLAQGGCAQPTGLAPDVMGPVDPDQTFNGAGPAQLVQTSGSTILNLSAAQTAPNYFHRAGASMADHDSALAACRSLAMAMDEPLGGYPGMGPAPDLGSVPGGYSAGGIIGLLVVAGINNAVADRNAENAEPMARAANVENCMVAFGWDVRALPQEEHAAFSAYSNEDLRVELSGRVGDAETSDVLLRTFGNELADSGGYTFGRAEGSDQSSFSLRLAPITDDEDYRQTLTYRDARRVSDDARIRRGMGLVAVRLRGTAGSAGLRLRFVRLDEDGARPAADREPNSFVMAFRNVSGQATLDQIGYFETPPGRWRLAEVLRADAVLSLCLGAPQFTIEAGQAVFAGTIDLSQSLLPDLGPDAGVVPAVRDVPVVPAVYEQGGQVRCAGAYLYALRLPETDVASE